MSARIEHFTEYDWFGEGRCRETNDDYEGAIEAYQEAIDINPKFAKAWYYKAKAHHRLGQKDKARECAQKTLELKPVWKKHVKPLLSE